MAPNPWLWMAHGKHPVANDFFTIGDDLAISRAFFDWVDRGVQPLIAQKDTVNKARFFRFWAKTPKPNNLLCGVVRSSCDRLARPYPLVLLGTGPLDGWEQHWDLLPVVCENIWGNLEHLASKRFSTLEQLKEELRFLKPPLGNWSSLYSLLPKDGAMNADLDVQGTESSFQELNHTISSLKSETKIILPLRQNQPADYFSLIVACHQLIKKQRVDPPTAVFVGGTLEQSVFAMFRNALSPEDFTCLWTFPERNAG